MKKKRLTAMLGSLMMAAVLFPQPVAAQSETVEEKPADAPMMIENKREGQWFIDLANQKDVKYVFVGRGVDRVVKTLGISLAPDSKFELIEIISSETTNKGRQTIQQFAERLMNTKPLEVAFQARGDDDGSLVTIMVITKPEAPDIATDLLLYKWSKTFEVALIHIKGEFDISKAWWGAL